MSDLAYWLGLNEYPKFGPKTFEKLQSHFPNMKAAFFASKEELTAAGVTASAAEGFIHEREDIHPEKVMQDIAKHEFEVVTILDDTYPSLLREIYDPPPVLYVWGYLPSSDVTHVAMVGSRKASPYGLQNADMIARQLSEAGAVVVSGLAFGIDEAAHMATVKAEGLTVAVLGGGLTQLTSRQRYVAEQIVETGGAVISEFPIHTPCLPQFFPVRNRVISGLSHGTLVVEAAEKSGTLITARAALEQNRDVFAIPGSIHAETSKGANNLIKMGAHIVTEAADILDLLHIDAGPVKKPAPTSVSKEEHTILELLSKTPVHINELIRKTSSDSAAIASTLSMLELKGLVQQIGGMYYILV